MSNSTKLEIKTIKLNDSSNIRLSNEQEYDYFKHLIK